ncbi:MAG: hypothetical protein HRU15_13945 [Planctomycetes bacterium]|nr:hypothetical protein [Planctomycetota bacterium]
MSILLAMKEVSLSKQAFEDSKFVPIYQAMAFIYRLSFLTAILLVIAVVDHRRQKSRGCRSMRPTEYAFLYTSAAIAALFGVFNDLFTSHISPAYFIYGKGITDSEHFTWKVCALGAQAGAVAGFVTAGALLFCRPQTVAVFSLLKYVFICMFSAVVSGIFAYFILPSFISYDFIPALPDSEKIAFTKAGSIHLGLYAGLLLALIACCINIRYCRPLAKHSDNDFTTKS